jgi:hypothetical protein
MKKTDQKAYLWDRSGEPDPEIARLETLLAQLRQPVVMPPLPKRPRGRLRRRGWMIAALSAAAALIVATALWFATDTSRVEWSVQTIAGRPVVDRPQPAEARTAADGRLAVGEWLVTDAVSRARISVPQIGRVDIEPNTRLQLLDARGREHRLSLARGAIHARIWAPPRLFFVNTPSATAIDLGCEYTLEVDDSGAGLVHVTSGWIAFQGDGREAFIPEGAVGATRPGVGPGTPYYEDAPSGYSNALATIDFGAADHPQRAAAFNLIVSSARRRDALTLWHLLQRGSAGERGPVFDRLAGFVPPPRGVTREAILAGDRRALDQWWDLLGVDDATWWKLWKKKT